MLPSAPVVLDHSLIASRGEHAWLILQVFKTLVENTKDIKGSNVENHKFCTSVHYRNVEEKVRDKVPTSKCSFGSRDKDIVPTILFPFLRTGRPSHNVFMIF